MYEPFQKKSLEIATFKCFHSRGGAKSHTFEKCGAKSHFPKGSGAKQGAVDPLVISLVALPCPTMFHSISRVESGLARGRAEPTVTPCFAIRDLMIWGSSETARRTRIQAQQSYCLLHVRSYLSAHRSKHKPLQPNDTIKLGFFLAGLIDSDGHINKQPQLVIAFHFFEVRCAYWIKSIIGYGSVRKVKAKQAYTYVLSHSDGLRKVAQLVHNKLRHPNKIHQYNTRLAQSYGLKHTSFQPLPILSNHWLAGFILGDGSFAIRTLFQRGKAPIESSALSFSQGGGSILRPFPEIRLECKVDQKYKTLLEPIQEAIGGYIGHRKPLDTYYYSTVSFRSASKLLHYLDQYQLIGPKYTQYVLWRRAFLIIQEKRHLSPYGVNLIKGIQSRIQQLKAIGGNEGVSLPIEDTDSREEQSVKIQSYHL